jgi:regulator of protease activity HflC (stomatin/prohibitin superfamily)
MLFIIALLLTVLAVVFFANFRDIFFKYVALGFGIFAFAGCIFFCVETVPAGHVKVATLFGKVQSSTYGEGLHLVNPFLAFHKYDLRQKTFKAEDIGVPAEDKLTTTMDVSVQYRVNGAMASEILKNTGSTRDLIEVHLIPKVRSILREQGKGVSQSQDFFIEAVQTRLQDTLREGLFEYLHPQGMTIDSVLIRNVTLPVIIRNAIAETKQREQEVIKQEAELARFAMEQEQKVKTAESELRAAELEAEKIKTLADSEAYKIKAINDQLARSPNYIKLKQVEQWNGVLPRYSGGENIPMIDLRETKPFK